MVADGRVGHLGRPRPLRRRLRVGHLDEHAGPTIVFPSPADGHIDPNRFRHRQFDPAVKTAELGKVRPHDLRCTAVKLWIASVPT